MLATIATATLSGESMKLVQKETGHVVVEFQNHKAKFHSHFLEKILSAEGIFIPPVLRNQFEEKEVVYMEDPLFEKAFIEVYSKFNLGTSYEWKN